MRRTSPKNSPGFTLVELLVVIGIIAILVAILLPALASAKKQANTVRCASQLKEIGNAMNIYVAEFKGFLPMVRHQTNGANNQLWPPIETTAALRQKQNKGFVFAANQQMNEYWYGYLLKYFVKGELIRNTAGDVSLKNYEKTPMWGCPEQTRQEVDLVSTSSADYNSGYGMGPYLLYRADRFKGANGTATGYPTAAHWNMIEDSATGSKKGRYMKISEVKKPAEKGFIADSKSWFLEIRDPSASGDPPVQYVAPGYQGAAIDQFDRYRHGKYPSHDGSIYSKSGGKQAFNVMFVDGHVETLSDVKKGYLVFRGNYPG